MLSMLAIGPSSSASLLAGTSLLGLVRCTGGEEEVTEVYLPISSVRR